MMRVIAPKCPVLIRTCAAVAFCGLVAACTEDGIAGNDADSPFAPGVDLKGEAVDGVEVGNRLLNAGEYELALDAFTRAALAQGMTQDVMIGIGTANLGLGRLGQAEKQLRQATETFPDSPEAWNNLGVVLMETDQIPEAQLVFRTAFALDNGESAAIRDNFRAALAKTENPDTVLPEEDYKLVRRDGGEYLLRTVP